MAARPSVNEERRTQILEAATEVFAEKGLHKTRMSDVAGKAGLSKGLLYWYFKNKEDLIDALMQCFFEEDLRALQQLSQFEDSVENRLRMLAKFALESFSFTFKRVSLLHEFYAYATKAGRLRVHLAEHYTRYRQALAALLQQGIDREEFRPFDTSLFAYHCVAFFEGLLSQWLIDPDAFDVKAHLEEAIPFLLSGLRAHPSPGEGDPQ